jgi:hypothetical protein
MPMVPRLGRLLDLIGLALMLAGGACYGWAYIGLVRLHDHPPTADHMLWVALAAFNHYNRVSTIGIVIAAIGLAVAITAAVVTHRSRRSPGVATP